MLNSIEFVITNGCFPVPLPSSRPYTFCPKPNTYSILDYNLIAKRHAPLIYTCRVLHTVLTGSVTDNMPIYLHLNLPTSSKPVLEPPPHTLASCTFCLSKRLKDPQTQDAYTSALAKNVANINLGARRAEGLQPRSRTTRSQPESIRMFHFFFQNPDERSCPGFMSCFQSKKKMRVRNDTSFLKYAFSVA